MSQVKDPDVDQPEPPSSGDDGDPAEPSGPGEPWWHSPWRLAVMAVALILLGAALGYAITSRRDGSPAADSVDVGFLQDMRWHHDQAVQMALAMLAKAPDEQDELVRGMATDILQSQQFENGVMAGQLRAWGRPEANESGTGMAWMGMPLPIDRMPGMAGEGDIDRLRSLTGSEADALFLELMINHHAGGLHMATDALARADSSEARALARSVVESQDFELAELRNLQAELAA
jgi:uncharacterized protein (DUF305 family)